MFWCILANINSKISEKKYSFMETLGTKDQVGLLKYVDYVHGCVHFLCMVLLSKQRKTTKRRQVSDKSPL